MISQRLRGFYDLLVALQLGLCLLFYWLHFVAVERFYSAAAAQSNYVVYCVLFELGLLMEAVRRYRSDSEWSQNSFGHKQRIAFQQTVFAAAPVIFFLVATKDQVISRLFLFSFMPVLYAVLLSSSWVLPRLVARLTLSEARKDNTLLVGSSKRILDLKHWLASKAQLGLHPVGVLCNENLFNVGGLPVLGRLEDLERVIRTQSISQVIVVELPSVASLLGQLATHCELFGVRFLVLSDLEEKFRHPVVYMENDGRQFFGLRQEPLESPFHRALKRLTDIAVALPVVLLLLPLAGIVVWLSQCWQSPGPLFYGQHRSGLQNRAFRIFKFRTMHMDNPDTARQASADDDRVYPAGRWFRKLSIDELPQFLNVLRGEMSVVGPRPHLEEHDELFARAMRNYYVRSLVKPGITGLAQVRGFRGEAKDEDAVRQRIASDIHYLENWSLSIDLLIMARTAWQMCFPPKTAY